MLDLRANLNEIEALIAELRTATGAVWLEFLDSTGSEPIAATHLHETLWRHWKGPVPNTGDIVVADFGVRFRVVDRVFYCLPEVPEVKVSLHCEEIPWK
jgi:hypothetical protein